MNNVTRSTPDCCSAEDLVALMYDELSPAVRTKVEDHLAVCDACIGEFADISLARLSVYEWNRDEFAEMKTPLIEIPLEPAVSWIDSLRGIFASPMRWATAGVSFAAVVAAIGFWAFAPGANDVADLNEPSVVERIEPTAPPAKETEAPVATNETKAAIADDPVGEDSYVEREYKAPVKKPSRTAQRSSQTVAESRSRNPRPVQNERTTAPRLVEFEDEDDVTLRLGELLADIDTRK